MDLPKQIMGGHFTFPKKYWTGISETAIDLIKKMMTVDPKNRITIDDAVNHPWFKVSKILHSLAQGYVKKLKSINEYLKQHAPV